MSSRCAVLVVGALEAGLWRGGTLARYAADEAGRARLSQDVQRLEVRVLLDVVDEEFRREPLPGVGAAQARALLAQRAARLFPAEARVACSPLDAEEGQLCALPEPAVLAPWLAALGAAQAQLAGIHSVPMLGPAMARVLGAGPAPLVLIFATRHGGLRQLLMDARGVRVARLSPLGSAGDAALIRRETTRFLRYVDEVNAAEAAPAVHCLMPIAMHGELASYRCHGLEAYFADAMLAGLLLEKPPLLDYSRIEERAGFLQHRRRKRAWRAAQGALTTAAVLIAVGFAETAQLRREAARLTAAASLLQEQDAAPSSPAQSRLTLEEVTEIERLGRRSPAMRDALATLGRVLAMHEAVMLQALAWRADETLQISFLLAAPPRQQQKELGRLLEALRAAPGVARVKEEAAPQAGNDNAPLDATALSAGQAGVRTLTLRFRAEAGNG